MDAFDFYVPWARRNAPYISRFCSLHGRPWVKRQHLRRVRNDTVYDLGQVRLDSRMGLLEKDTGLTIDQHVYCFDLILRYVMYGQFVGSNSFYLHHPIRDTFRISANIESRGKSPPIAITFAPYFRNVIHKLSRDEYVTCIKVLRERVRHYGLLGAPSGDVHRDILRKMAAEARLRPKLRAEAAVIPIIAAVLSTAIGTALAGPIGTVAGTAVTISAAVWTGTSRYLPPNVSDISWLRWALRWDIEDQSRNVSRDDEQ